MHYYLKTHACVDNPAHHALHEFDQTTRFVCPPAKWERRHDPTPTPAIGLKAAMASAEINTELICPLGTPSFPPGMHDYYPKKHNPIKGVSKCMISRQEHQAMFNEDIVKHKDHTMKFTRMAP